MITRKNTKSKDWASSTARKIITDRLTTAEKLMVIYKKRNYQFSMGVTEGKTINIFGVKGKGFSVFQAVSGQGPGKSFSLKEGEI